MSLSRALEGRKELLVMARKEQVSRVIDGDTFRTTSGKNPVRLARVNAPEKGARGATAGKQKLARLIEGKEVSIRTIARDVYGRSVVNVKVRKKSVNKYLNIKPVLI